MILWDIGPLSDTRHIIPKTCISIVNIMWELSLVSRGGTMLQRQHTENVAV